jgi:hypothetical protein
MTMRSTVPYPSWRLWPLSILRVRCRREGSSRRVSVGCLNSSAVPERLIT